MRSRFATPARPYVPTPYDADCEESYETLRNAGLRSRKSLTTHYGYVRGFYVVNERVADDGGWDWEDVIHRWASQAVAHNGYQITTVEGIVNELTQLRLDAREPEVAHHKIQKAVIRAGLQRLGKDHRPTNTRHLHELQALWAPLEEPGPYGSEEKEMRAFWYLCIATGSRASHVAKAHKIELDDTSVIMTWGGRKVRGAARAGHRYLFEWSGRPPPDVVRQVHALRRKPFYFAGSEKPSACLGRWLKKKGHIMSTDTRTRMDSVLLPMVESGEMSRDHYEELMDHTVTTARKNYRTLPL